MGISAGLLAWVLFFAPFAGGAVLLYLGLRGRRTDDHPICRQCGFDLFGLPADRTNCPECGAELRYRRAVTIGHRQRIGSFVGTGAVILFVAGTGLTVLTLDHRGVVDLNEWKPVRLLAREMGSNDAEQRDAALRELHSRLAKGTITSAHAPLIIEPILAWQSDHGREWHTGWAVLLEDAHARGIVPQDKFEQYALGTFYVTLRARPVLHRGDALPYELLLFAKGGRPPTGVTATWLIKGHSVAGRRMRPDPDRMPLRRHVPAFGADPRIRIDADLLGDLPDGPTSVTFDVTIQIWAGARAAERKVALTAPVDLVSPERDTVILVDAPAVRAAAAASVRVVRHPAFGPYGEWDVRIEKGGAANVTLAAIDPPIGLAYDAFLKAGGYEFPLGDVTFRPGSSPQGPVTRHLRAHLAATFPQDARVDVVLRPSPRAARGTVELVRICDGEIVFRDRIVRWDSRKKPVATTRPTAFSR